jgi:hypothetical protein
MSRGLQYGWGAGHSTYQVQSTKQQQESQGRYTHFGGTVEIPKSGASSCKKCGSKIGSGGIRVKQ